MLNFANTAGEGVVLTVERRMIMAIKCISKNCPFTDVDMDNCYFIDCCDFVVEQSTNADRIRAMSDEELADVIANGVGCVLKAPHCMDVDCTSCILKWLQQPAEGE